MTNLQQSKICPRCGNNTLDAYRLHAHNLETILLCRTNDCVFPFDEDYIEQYIQDAQIPNTQNILQTQQFSEPNGFDLFEGIDTNQPVLVVDDETSRMEKDLLGLE
ncbi:hypothetical protein AKO1_002934 [Acrasis kona]|uniref:Zinc finger Ogr/Delta-type domain-containing protein n=1 Tax=Acrasis kona TaxID=1008807 RepID=A0AAW2Z8V9_9EUKA